MVKKWMKSSKRGIGNAPNYLRVIQRVIDKFTFLPAPGRVYEKVDRAKFAYFATSTSVFQIFFHFFQF